MKIAVTGGKGGVGKSTIASALIRHYSEAGRILAADLDVDNPCLSSMLNMNRPYKVEDAETFKPSIVAAKCIGCHKCVDACEEHALYGLEGSAPTLYDQLCSGCGACKLVCPANAIEDDRKVLGQISWYNRGNITLIEGRITPGEARSPIVARQTALAADKEYSTGVYKHLIIDTMPGVANPVAQALLIAEKVVAVTEPTLLGIHDIMLTLELSDYLGKTVGIVINKADISREHLIKLRKICAEKDVKIIVEIPYSRDILFTSVSQPPGDELKAYVRRIASWLKNTKP